MMMMSHPTGDAGGGAPFGCAPFAFAQGAARRAAAGVEFSNS